MFKSMWGVFEVVDGFFVYKRGWECIFENWYCIWCDYILVDLNIDLLGWIKKYFEFVNVGGNFGKVNSFFGIDFNDFIGGVFNVVDLFEGNNFVCFFLELVKVFVLNLLLMFFKIFIMLLKLVNDVFFDFLFDFNCGVMEEFSKGGNDVVV